MNPPAQNADVDWLRPVVRDQHAPRPVVVLGAPGQAASDWSALQRVAPPDLPVWVAQLPGRQDRFLHDPYTKRADATADFAPVVSRMNFPQVMGYCAGGKLALSIATDSRARGAVTRVILVDPTFLLEDVPSFPRDSDSATLVDWLRQNADVPPAILDDPSIFTVLEPTLRADFAMFDAVLEDSEADLPERTQVHIVLGSELHERTADFARVARRLQWSHDIQLVGATSAELAARPDSWLREAFRISK